MQSTMSPSGLLALMGALDLSASQDDENSEVVHDKNSKPISKPRANNRSKNARGSSAKLPRNGQWDTSRPSTARNAEPGALGTSNRAPKPRRPKPKAQDLDKSWSMYPALHDSVCRLLEVDDLSFTFFAIDEDRGSIEEYDTNIMGRFKCANTACPRTGWTSKVIAITIRMYSGQQYNARVYHQRCKGCESLSQPFPDDSYAERIAYRLKKWSGIEMDQPTYTGGDIQRPHEINLCEGCRHGHCRFSTR